MNELNPYQSPPEPTESVETIGSAESIDFAVATGRFDFVDFAAAMVPANLFVFLPAALLGLYFQSVVVGILSAVIFLAPFFLVAIRGVTVSAAGIQFQRWFGNPKCLTWNQITAVSRRPPMEVFLHGWISLQFPPRESTTASSLQGHFRIDWQEGWLYFPPDNEEQFQAIVAQHLKSKQSGNDETPSLTRQ